MATITRSMMRSLLLLILCSAVVMLIPGCTAPTPFPTTTNTRHPPSATPLPTRAVASVVPTNTSLPTLTPTPEPTETALPTATSTATTTPNPTASPTHIRVTRAPQPTKVETPFIAASISAATPGVYPQNRCVTIAVLGSSGAGPTERQGSQPAIMCVTNVEVLADGALKVYVTWSLDQVRREWRYVAMNQGGEFKSTYLLDNHGNRYEAREISGAARDPAGFPSNRPRTAGWYLFPPPQSGATVFILRNDGQQVNIAGIEIK